MAYKQRNAIWTGDYRQMRTVTRASAGRMYRRRSLRTTAMDSATATAPCSRMERRLRDIETAVAGRHLTWSDYERRVYW
jgi:hypothetical protein